MCYNQVARLFFHFSFFVLCVVALFPSLLYFIMLCLKAAFFFFFYTGLSCALLCLCILLCTGSFLIRLTVQGKAFIVWEIKNSIQKPERQVLQPLWSRFSANVCSRLQSLWLPWCVMLFYTVSVFCCVWYPTLYNIASWFIYHQVPRKNLRWIQ